MLSPFCISSCHQDRPAFSLISFGQFLCYTYNVSCVFCWSDVGYNLMYNIYISLSVMLLLRYNNVCVCADQRGDPWVHWMVWGPDWGGRSATLQEGMISVLVHGLSLSTCVSCSNSCCWNFLSVSLSLPLTKIWGPYMWKSVQLRPLVTKIMYVQRTNSWILASFFCQDLLCKPKIKSL